MKTPTPSEWAQQFLGLTPDEWVRWQQSFTSEKWAALLEDYALAQEAHERREQMAELQRTAVTAPVEEATAAAQALIMLRRAARRS